MDQVAQPPDVLGTIIGAPPGSAVDRLRVQRPEIHRHTQGYHDVLLSPPDPGGVSLAERALIAWTVATKSHHGALAAHYRALLDQRDGTLAAAPTPRLRTILDHVGRVTAGPTTATRADIDRLRSLGLSPRDIVALTQIVAFVAYQVRAAAGLALLVADPAP